MTKRIFVLWPALEPILNESCFKANYLMTENLILISADITVPDEQRKQERNPDMNFLQILNKQFEEINWLNQKVYHNIRHLWI